MAHTTVFLLCTSNNNKKFTKSFQVFRFHQVCLSLLLLQLEQAGLPSLEISNLLNVSSFFSVWSLCKNTISLGISRSRELIFVILIIYNKFFLFINCFSLIISFCIHIKNEQKNKLKTNQLSVRFQYSRFCVILYAQVWWSRAELYSFSIYD